MATIEQRKDKWRVYWKLNGTRTGAKQSTTFSSESHAWQAKRLAEGHRHHITRDEVYELVLDIPPKPVEVEPLPTVAEWAETWLASRTSIGSGQAARYRQQLRDRILPEIGELHLDEVGGQQIALLLKKIRADLKDVTATRYYACLHAMFAYAVREKKIPDNPAKRTDFVRDMIAEDDDVDTGDDHVYLDPWEFELICANATPHAALVLRLLAGTGMRWSEATALFVEGVKLKAKPTPSIRVYRAWKKDGEGKWFGGSTKGRKNRTVTVGPRFAAEILTPLIKDRRGKVLLLQSPRGMRLEHSNWRFRYFEPAVDAAMRCAAHPPTVAADGGAPTDGAASFRRGAVSACECPGVLRRRPTIHDLRHTHAAWMIEAGHPIPAISRRLGHSTTAVTDAVYAGIMPAVDSGLAISSDVATGPAVGAQPGQGEAA